MEKNIEWEEYTSRELVVVACILAKEMASVKRMAELLDGKMSDVDRETISVAQKMYTNIVGCEFKMEGGN